MSRSLGDRLYAVFVVVCIAFLAFVGGAMLMLAEKWPYDGLRQAYLAGHALLVRRAELENPLSSDLWRKARFAERGVTVNEPSAQPGYTLYTSGHEPSAMLIDLDGRVLHRWHLPYSRAWDESAVIQKPVPDTQTYFRKAVVYPNGDLLVVYDGVGDTPHGYGVVKMDRDSNILWKFLDRAHHDIDVAPDGRVYTLTHAIAQDPIEGLDFMKPPRIDDWVVELSPEGKELRRVHLLRALYQSDYRRVLEVTPWYLMRNGDYLHTNSVDYIDAATAERFGFSEGQLVLSMREPGTIGVLDLDRKTFVWGLRGPWIGQHDADLLDNGHLMLFDNNGRLGPGPRSRVLELDPRTMEITWSYEGTPERPLESRLRAAQQRQPNGNTLVTESDGGRLIEVDPSGRVVWEFLNPARGGDGDSLTAVVSWGQRLAEDYFTDDFRAALTPQ